MSRRSLSPKRSTPTEAALVISEQPGHQLVEEPQAFAGIRSLGNFGCGLCHKPGCPGTCPPQHRLPNEWYADIRHDLNPVADDNRIPKHIIYGQRHRTAPNRCRLCTARDSGEAAEGDPVCPHPNKGGAGHDWMAVVNPITDYFWKTIHQFWEKQVPVGTRLTATQLSILTSKLAGVFLENELRTFQYFGVQVKLAFDKPARVTTNF